MSRASPPRPPGLAGRRTSAAPDRAAGPPARLLHARPHSQCPSSSPCAAPLEPLRDIPHSRRSRSSPHSTSSGASISKLRLHGYPPSSAEATGHDLATAAAGWQFDQDRLAKDGAGANPAGGAGRLQRQPSSVAWPTMAPSSADGDL